MGNVDRTTTGLQFDVLCGWMERSRETEKLLNHSNLRKLFLLVLGYKLIHKRSHQIQRISHDIYTELHLANTTKRFISKQRLSTLNFIKKFLEQRHTLITGDNDTEIYMSITMCYMWKPSVVAEETNTAIACPMSKAAAKVFQIFFEAGIWKYWEDEFYKVPWSNSMRDRIIHDKQVVRQEEMKITCPLSLEDKAKNLFVGMINDQCTLSGSCCVHLGENFKLE